MPAPLAVDKEAVRVLVVAVGVAEAARQTGLGLSVLKKWSAEGGWLAHCKPQVPEMPLSMRPQAVTGITAPADALANTLKNRHRSTKLSLSRFVQRASAKAATLPSSQLLAQARDVKAVALTAAQVWPEDKAATDVRINVFAGASLPPAIEVATTVVRCTETVQS